MGAHFPHPTHIPNSLMTHKSIDPWECDDFSYVHFAIPDPHTCIKKYYTNNNLPLGLTINEKTGKIYGTILPFCKQLCAKDKYPLECLKRDGSNFRHTGRFKPEHKDYWFIIYADYLEDLWHKPEKYKVSVPSLDKDGKEQKDKDGNTIMKTITKTKPGYWEKCVTPGTISKCVFIRELKDYDINNSLWWLLYIERCKWEVGDFVFGVEPVKGCCDYTLKDLKSLLGLPDGSITR